MEDFAITPGERYQRRTHGKDYVWVTGHEHGSVGYRHTSGMAAIPEVLFRKMFGPAPKRQRAKRARA